MNALHSRLTHELNHFRSMPETARRLSISYFLRSAAYPLISIFTSAYIWQTNQDLTLLIIYNIGNFLVLPPVFMANKWLLSHIALKKLYAISTVLTGVSSLMVVFYQSNRPEAYFIYGIVYGLANGIYWANRNFLTLRHTTSDTRSYFTGLQFTLSTFASIIVPLLAGWIIVLSTTTHIFPSRQFAYEVLVGIAFLLLLIGGFILKGVSIQTPHLPPGKRKPFSRHWNPVRWLSVAIGCSDSPLYVLPTVLVLQTLGNEGVLGSISSVMAVLTAIITYIFGRKYRQTQFYPVFTGLLIMFAISGIPLAFGMGSFGVLWYIVIANLTDNLIWTANEPKIMDMMDEEVHRSHLSHYDVILDREWFVNIGRVAMYLVFLSFTLIDQALALRITAVAGGLIALACMLPVMLTNRKV